MKSRDPAIVEFLKDIEAVYRKHGLAIGHEDEHGGFLIHKLDEIYIKWLQGAHDERGVEEMST